MTDFRYRVVKATAVPIEIWQQESAADLDGCYEIIVDGKTIGMACHVKKTLAYIAFDTRTKKLLKNGEWLPLDRATEAVWEAHQRAA